MSWSGSISRFLIAGMGVVLVALPASFLLSSTYPNFVRAPAQDGAGRREALRGDPGNPYRWTDLGDSLMAAGDVSGARYCFTRAVALGPNLPPILLHCAEFHFRNEDIPPALRLCLQILEMVRDHDQEIFDSYTQLPIAAVLEFGMPQSSAPAEAWLRYLLDKNLPSAAYPTWKWAMSHSSATDTMASQYATYLLQSHQYYDAAEIWSQYLGGRRGDYLRPNRLYNGGFENQATKSPLDWTPGRSEHAHEEIDPNVAHSGKSSYRIGFDGASNLDYHGVSQLAVVTPGTYRFEAWVKAAGITTDQGVAFRITDAESPQRLDIHTPSVTGAVDWMKLELSFPMPPATRLVKVQLVRRPSWRFDNQLGGALWVDSVQLWNAHPILPQQPGRSQRRIKKAKS